MGVSIRARRVLQERAADRQAARAAAAREADDIRRAMLSRVQAARYLGLAPSSLRDLWAAGKGPKAIKFGHCRQSRIFYPVEELDRWRLDPLNYSTPARDDSIGPFEPPRRGGNRKEKS
jgi:hypothetical protein